jgi:hypothetical protein
MNNQVYLKKLIREERMNAKVDMLREHIQIAKQEVEVKQRLIRENANHNDLKRPLNEQVATDTETEAEKTGAATKDAPIQSNAPEQDKLWKNQPEQKTEWDNTSNLATAEKMLEKMGAKVRAHGPNPVSYELTVDIGPVEGKSGKSYDKFRFYSDQSVYSFNSMRRLGWSIMDNNKGFNIYNFGPNTLFKIDQKNHLAKLDTNGKFTNIAWEKAQAEKDEHEASSGLDKFQTVLDWVGMLPVIGDAIDAINAIIYFVRGKYLDGFLSSIAIIPVIGSVISLGAKGILKGARSLKITKKLEKLWRGVKNFKNPKNIDLSAEIFEDFLKDGVISSSQLKALGHGFENIEGMLRRARGGVSKIPFVNTKSAEDTLKQAENFMATQSKGSARAIEDLNKAAKSGAKTTDTAANVTKTVVSKPGFVRKVYNRTKQMGVFNNKQLKQIRKKVESNFVQKINHPDKMALLIKFAPEPSVLKKTLNDDLLDMAVNLEKTNPKMLDDLTSMMKSINPNSIGKRGFNFDQFSGNEIQEFWKQLKTNPQKYGDITDDLAKTVADHTQKNNGFMWEVFKQDDINKLFASQSPDVQGLQIGLKKNLDIISNEVTDAAEDFGISEYDDPQGVIWPLTYYAIQQEWPGTDLKKTREDIAEFTEFVGDKGAKVVEMGTGIPLTQFEKYEIGAEDYTYDPSADK